MGILRTSGRPWWKCLHERTALKPAPQSRRVHLAVEALERRDVLDAGISGTVMQTLNVSGLFAKPSSTLFGPVEGVTVRLDNVPITTSNAQGAYSLSGVDTGTHTISIDLPAGFLGFSAQSLSYTVQVASTDFTNLNFALTPKDSALVQNLFELVLGRPADFNGYNALLADFNGGDSVGDLIKTLYKSTEFKQTVLPIATLVEGFFPGPLGIGAVRHSVELQNLGITQDATVLDFLYSQPFVSKFGDVSQISDSSYVNLLYKNLLGRNANKKELNKWLAELQDGTNRGQLALDIVALPRVQSNNLLQRRIAVSLAYLGVLGREATPTEVQKYVRTGARIDRVANLLAKTTEFKNLTGFTDTFFWDVKAQQIKPAVEVLSRLQQYNPTTQQFDIAVTANSITSTAGASAKNVYFIAHGWAPGLTEAVLLNSTPGDPLKSWETASSDDPDPAWLYAGTNQVSSEGLAQAIIDADPRAVVIAYSWIDLSATPLGNDTRPPFNLTGNTTFDSDVITNIDASQLGAGMTVTGPGIPAGTIVEFVSSQTSVILSQKATATASVSLTFAGASASTAVEQFLYAGQSESRTQLAGLLLAEAIKEALGPGFFPGEGLLHLIGHSHGAKVATIATVTLDNESIPVSHLTLLESPEAGPQFGSSPLHAPGLGGAQNFLWYFLKDLEPGREPVTGSRQATGNTFVDNYFSQEGFGSALRGYDDLENVVDVLLHPEDLYGALSITDVAGDATTLFGSHDYPPAWYGQASLQNPNGPANTLNGLTWSPLINPTTTLNLDDQYVQTQQNAPGQFVQTQFELTGNNDPPTTTTPSFTALQYAQQSSVGQVVDNGSSITLSVGPSSTQAIDKITFNPVGAGGTSGTGMDFQFQFSGVDPGEHVELVIWINGMASVPQTALTQPLGNTLGFISIPLFSMDGSTAGSAAQNGTISLDGYRVGLILGPFNSVIDVNTGATPFVPTLGFSLVTATGSTASVTISNMRQLTDGAS